MNISALIALLRPHQWLKNLMLFFPPFLGGVLFNPEILQKGVLPFLVFCLASSATYIYNDIRDRDQDRIHPQKRHRPIASGSISITQATITSLCLLAGSLLLSLKLPVAFLAWMLAYLALSFAYSTFLKDLPVFDIFCIAGGFVFRLFAGGAAFGVVVSGWLFVSVLLLAIFLSVGKRLSEKIRLGETASAHRNTLGLYPAGFLDGCMYMSGVSVLVCYSVYTLSFPGMVYTVPLCAFGMYRYMWRIKSGLTGDPTESLLKDSQLFLVSLGWVILVGWVVYV